MLHTESVDRLLSLASTDRDAVLEEMEERAERDGFPTVGPEVGSTLRLAARLADVDTVFELGSGYGYSAYWIAPVVGSDGTIVLTEFDADELDAARTYFERGGYDDRAVFEHGDALETVERYDGPFDMVLLDHENDRYVEGFEAVREKVAPGGFVIADNVLHSTGMDPDDVVAYLEDGTEPDTDSSLPGIMAYYERVRTDPDFETTVLPVGEGLFASVRVR